MGPGYLVAVATVLALLVSSPSATTAAAWPDLLPNIDWVDTTPDGDRNDRPSPDPTPRQAAPGVDWNGDGKINKAFEADRDASGFADVFERDLDADGVLDYQDPDYWGEYYQKRMPGYDYDGDALYDDDPKDRVYGPEPAPKPAPKPAPIRTPIPTRTPRLLRRRPPPPKKPPKRRPTGKKRPYPTPKNPRALAKTRVLLGRSCWRCSLLPVWP